MKDIRRRYSLRKRRGPGAWRPESVKNEIVENAARLENSFLIIPDAPGIGVELAEDAQEKHPPVPANVVTKLHVDGSVVDQ